MAREITFYMDYADATEFMAWFLSEEGSFVADGDFSPEKTLVRLEQPFDWALQELASPIALANVKWAWPRPPQWYRAGDKF
jgi:hypothetical protein